MARQGKETGSKGKITKKSVDALIAECEGIEGGGVSDGIASLQGSALKATAGACSYVVQYRLGGRGVADQAAYPWKHGVLTPDEARKLAKEKLGEVAEGFRCSRTPERDAG